MSDIQNTETTPEDAAAPAPPAEETTITETTTTETATPAGDDAGQAEAQSLMDEATDKGFLGVKVDPIPNEEYSLETGPDSPQLPDDHTHA